ncbi:unnamed protein product [Amoebophrya sp. A120]|nr:unnamed protein product [Amoebophrya sp. A120]|eukprot:GSA120T00014861001.1
MSGGAVNNKMLVKCETKSNRVKGVSFHPKLSWCLASLHNGTIQLWDYRFGTLIEKFEGEHEGGPVRGVCFHNSQPLFCSGGDDYKIKVWNYKQKRAIFTLQGHLDYIRTVQFHHEAPWILSSSDDQTVRIWNWQNRGCIAVLTGHNHYVMCAQFHPSEDMVCSASLDQSIRIWDISGLRDKGRGGSGMGSGMMPGSGDFSGNGASNGNNGANDLFGTYDAVVKYVLEGHDRGVNWASFHPTLPLVVSGADDRLIKLWRMSESKAWEVDTLKGHFSNVSSVCFHPRKDLIISNSEDRTIRVWDCTKRTQIHTFRRETDRFWVIATHPTSQLVAVGHDGGMVVFKLDRERALAQVDLSKNTLFHVRGAERNLVAEPLEQPDGRTFTKTLCTLRRPTNAMQSGLKSLEVNQFSPSEGSAVLVYYQIETGSYDLCIGEQPPLSGYGSAVCFVQRNRFAVLQQSGTSIGIYSFQNELTKKFDHPIGQNSCIDNIFCGGLNRIILKCRRENAVEERSVLFDIVARKVVNEVSIAGGVRYVVWSANFQYCALFSKHNLVLVDKNFEVLFTLHENIRIKSGAWDSQNSVFVYSTLSHVKYCLLNGDSGIIHSLQHPIYIQAVFKQHLFYIDREKGEVHKQRLNCTEYLFKLSLASKNFDDVKMWIKNGRLGGNVVIGYLKKKGYPEVALHFVEDQHTRFNLALEYGHIAEAMKAAQELQDATVWTRLGTEASRQGSAEILEMSLQKTKNLDALSFHYLLTGNLLKLGRMLTIAEKRQDSMRRFNNALMLGSVEERVKVLAETGQVPLAYLTAKAHGLTELTEALESNVEKEKIDRFLLTKVKTPKLLIPPVPLRNHKEQLDVNWPQLQSQEKIFEHTKMENVPDHVPQQHIVKDLDPTANAFQDAMDGVNDDGFGDANLDSVGDGWEDIGDDIVIEPVAGDAAGKPQKPALAPGESPQQAALKQRKLCVDLVIAGQFDDALDYLRRRIGLVDAKPLLPYFENQFLGSQCSVPGLPNTPSQLHLLMDGPNSPRLLYSYASLVEMKREGHRQVQSGKFDEALAIFKKLLHCITLAVAGNAEEEKELTELITTASSYVLALMMQIAKKDTTDVKRGVELVNLMTVVQQNIEPPHQFLFLRQAMTATFKAENFIDSAHFATKILQKNINPAAGGFVEKTVQQARGVLRNAEERGTNALPLSFDVTRVDPATAKICAESLTVIPEGEQYERCSFCAAVYKKMYLKRKCRVCGLGEVGKQVMGIEFRKKF